MVPCKSLYTAWGYENIGQRDRISTRWVGGVVLGGCSRTNGQPTLPRSVGSLSFVIVGNKQRSLQTVKRLAAVPPDLRFVRPRPDARYAVSVRDHIDADLQGPTGKKTIPKTAFKFSYSSSLNHQSVVGSKVDLLGSAPEQWSSASQCMWGQPGRELNPLDGPDDFSGSNGPRERGLLSDVNALAQTNEDTCSSQHDQRVINLPTCISLSAVPHRTYCMA